MNASDYFDDRHQVELAAAAARGDEAAIDRQLAAGAEIDAAGRDGMTALIWALLQENKEGFVYLLKKGADPNLALGMSTVSPDRALSGNSAVSLAAAHEDPWFLEIVLSYGGDPNLKNAINGLIPIFKCIRLLDHERPVRRLQHLEILTQAGSDLNARDNAGRTPMMLAANLNRYDMVFQLLQAGSDPRARTPSGYDLVAIMQRIRIHPKSELVKWRTKVVDELRRQGISVDGN